MRLGYLFFLAFAILGGAWLWILVSTSLARRP
jgi:hypothetical protein